MIGDYIGQETIELTQEEIDKIPSLVGHQLESAVGKKPILRYKFMDMYGKWAVIDVIVTEEGVNLLCSRIQIKDK